MFFRKYKILGSSLIVAACISISFPSQASMTPMQNNYTLKGLSQHQQRETSAVIALKTDNDDNTFDKKSLLISSIVIISMIIFSVLGKGFFRLVPILLSVIIGYIVSIFFGIVDFTPIVQAKWIGLSDLAMKDLTTMPVFNSHIV